MTTRKSHFPFLAIILACVTVAHGLLLIMDGVYWDSWLLYAADVSNDWETIYTMWARTGIPWRAFPHQLLGYTPDFVLAHHVLTFFFIACAACLVYLILVRSGFFTRLESLLIACLSAVYPALQTAFVLEVTEFLFSYFAFLVGVYFALLAHDTRGRARIGWRIGSLVFFSAGFTTRSLLVFYFGFLIFLFAYFRRQDRPSSKTIRKELLEHIDFLVLPFLFWFLIDTFFPSTSGDAAANEIRSDLPLIWQHLRAFFTNAGVMPAARIPSLAPIVLATGLAFFLLWQWLFPRFKTLAAERASFPLSPWITLGYSLLLLFLAAFPYAVVGKSPGIEGWTTRHALLSGLPMAILFAGLAKFLYRQPEMIWQRIGYGALVFLVTVFSLTLAQNYLTWQTRWIKDQSVMLQLRDNKIAQQSSTVWIRDTFPPVGQEPYRYYEWSSMFKVLWGGESRIGLDDVRDRNAVLKLKFERNFNLRDYRRKGCQALLTIQPKTRGKMPDALDYFALKFSGNADALENYVRQVARIYVTVAENQSPACASPNP